MINFVKIDEWIEAAGAFSIISSLGFEDRVVGLYEHLKRLKSKSSLSVLLDYDKPEANEPQRTKTIRLAESVSSYVVIYNNENLDKLCDHREQLSKSRILVDITGMSRVLIFRILACLDSNELPYCICYTEAEQYYPDKEYYEKLCQYYKKDGSIFRHYEHLEEKEVIYSKNCNIVVRPQFQGDFEPGRPPLLISFLTFKRSRLQAVFSAFEFSRRYIFLSVPQREELGWRKELLTMINSDILQSRISEVIDLTTLDPMATYEAMGMILGSSVFGGSLNTIYDSYNIYLAPLGSKMQTVGSYFFWRDHRDISVVFSQPQKYFPKKFSSGYKETFIVETVGKFTFC